MCGGDRRSLSGRVGRRGFTEMDDKEYSWTEMGADQGQGWIMRRLR